MGGNRCADRISVAPMHPTLTSLPIDKTFQFVILRRGIVTGHPFNPQNRYHPDDRNGLRPGTGGPTKPAIQRCQNRQDDEFSAPGVTSHTGSVDDGGQCLVGDLFSAQS
ncbi:hypothetical protein K227x_50900 [Rubripirellula lacrimiformis]|uniref:Uncharacterized protein n=1 Tax=Rubripirellula lacrimiformis TaxID=1930273 RepID=A0A517NHR2_9BACT|nr:hypothetical protein K227x_50900 [Rubripirellula lacrimiformis]